MPRKSPGGAIAGPSSPASPPRRKERDAKGKRGWWQKHGEQLQLHLGDCLELLPERVPDGSVDLILCDLPFGMTQNAWDMPLPLEAMWREFGRVCRGTILLLAQTPYDKVLGASNLRMLRYEWIWSATTATGFLNAKTRPLRSHCNILVFWDGRHGRAQYHPQFGQGTPYRRRGTDRSSENYRPYSNGRGVSVNHGVRYPRTVLEFKGERGLHPTQKPVALMDYLIRTYTRPGQVVLDPCMGSGTTGVAALRTGRRFIGMELCPKYFAVAQARLRQPANFREQKASQE